VTVLRALLVGLAALLLAVPAAASNDGAATSWRLLDYIAVDYPGAVSDRGKVASASEYAEMKEFAGTVQQQLQALPDKPAKAAILKDAAALDSAILAKDAPDEVARLSRALSGKLLAAYPVPLAPPATPDLARGKSLFETNCASCHGLDGSARTPMAAKLNPPPIAFANRARAANRTPFALYQVIDQGLDGTAMASFASLPAQDKWDLAYYAGRFAYPPALVAEGRKIWADDPSLRRLIPDLAALSSLSEQALAAQIGPGKAGPVIAFLRTEPRTLAAQEGAASLTIARQRLSESLAAYEAGNREAAKQLALAAYLDGFEPVEGVLGARNATLLGRVEAAMGDYRRAISAGRPPAELRSQAQAIEGLFTEVEQALSPDSGSAVSAFLGGFTILLREGLEALLIVVAMLAFLKKADQPAMTRPVHQGWIAALVAGGLTWWAATSLITVSGASREFTEGFGSLLAAAVLLFVGIWMHGKAQAGQWQRYIRDRMSKALTGRSAWFLFGLSFIAVYREVFETILFYAAMAAQGYGFALAMGGLAGAVLLAGIAVAMLRYSRKLPISTFFIYSSALVAILAVVLAGKGVAALQEAGMIAATPLLGVPKITILGLFPTLQGVAAQVLAALILAVGFAWNRRSAAAASAAPATVQ